MRICIDVTPLAQDRMTGVQRVILELTRALILHKEHTFVLLAFVPRANAWRLHELFGELPLNVRKVFLPIPQRGFMGFMTFFQKMAIPIEAMVGPIDLFHTFDWFTLSSCAPSTSFIFDLTCQKFPEWHSPANVELQTKRVNYALRRNSHFFCLSQATRNDFIDFYRAKKNATSVVYPGVRLNKAITPFAKVKKIHPYFLCVGTNEPRKNFSRLLQAYETFRSRNRHAPSLVVVGMKTEDLSVGEGVLCVGYVREKFLPFLYKKSRAFIYPSLYEGFGLPVVEALASGSLVITGNVSSLPEAGGKAPLYCNPTNSEDLTRCMVQALTMTETERVRRAKVGRVHVANFSYEQSAQKMILVWRGLISSSS